MAGPFGGQPLFSALVDNWAWGLCQWMSLRTDQWIWRAKRAAGGYGGILRSSPRGGAARQLDALAVLASAELDPGTKGGYGDARRPRGLPGTGRRACQRLGERPYQALGVSCWTLAWRSAAATRPGCRRRPSLAPQRVPCRDVHRRAVLLSSGAERGRTPGRRSDRTDPGRSAALWGLELRSTSPSSSQFRRLGAVGSG